MNEKALDIFRNTMFTLWEDKELNKKHNINFFEAMSEIQARIYMQTEDDLTEDISTLAHREEKAETLGENIIEYSVKLAEIGSMIGGSSKTTPDMLT